MGGRGLIIRPARPNDADNACAVLRASIIELCGDHHNNQAAVLEAWLANKTVANLGAWIADPESLILVAELDGAIAAVGGLRKVDGHVMLNYVSPAFQYRGVSKAMMAALEAEARTLGHEQVALESTRTAHAFYLSIGYADTDETFEKHGQEGFPMVKAMDVRRSTP